MSERPRILHVTRNLPPLVGGMERLNWHIAEELSKRADVMVVAPNASISQLPTNTRGIGVSLRPLWRFLLGSLWSSAWSAIRWKPEIILAGSGLTALPSLIAARLTGARSAVYVHGLDISVESRIYQHLWHPALRASDVVITNSHQTADLAKSIGITEDKIRIVHPGVEIRTEFSLSGANDFVRRNGLEDRTLLLSVGRLSARKGLKEFVGRALPSIVKGKPDVLLLIVGEAPSDALHTREQTRESIEAVAADSGVSKNVRFLGRLSDHDLAMAFRCATIHVFPVRSERSDPEGFGMVAIEAAAHGLPTVAFASGGVVDSVEDGISGRLVAPGDYSKFSETVLAILSEGKDQWEARTTAFAEHFAWPAFGDRMVHALGITSFSTSAPVY